ncbi:PREDICTED: beta-glucosidase 12-like [Prunus mume]|uniref:Beta-glucosidase 12-like n=1 Tax=Prunus mume TaxID=102107 RepID=A0ABM0PS58_PRUMU|nr:PREDICTED: beta-glucosidase 12-like [Prunus mume]
MAMMRLGTFLFCVVLLFGSAFTNGKAAVNTDPQLRPICERLDNRKSFDDLEPGFIFGTASATYQCAGAVKTDGRGPSIWDNYTHSHPERIKDGSNGDIAVDQYHRYKDDVAIMKNISVDAYRMSISWSRLLPNGTLSGGVNMAGINYYNSFIDELINSSITPFVTIFHWDLPQALNDEYGGFLSPKVVDDYLAFAKLCFENFGNRVKHWITLNEPYTVSHHGYAVGCHAPGRCSAWQNLSCTGGDSGTEPYLVTHHQLLAHAAAVKLYKDEYQAYQNGSIGITLVSHWFEPASNSTIDKSAANRSLDFMFGWFMDPLTYGDYPHSMRSLVKERLPKFTDEESKLLKGSYDFIGINYYSARYASNGDEFISAHHDSYLTDPHVNVTTELNGVPIGPQAASDWLYVYPKGIYDLLNYTKNKYNDPIIYITENGVDEFNDPKIPLEQALNDTNRTDFYYHHLCYLHKAMSEGAKVKGYFAWSLVDNFEWNDGYTVRFGIIYVDYRNGTANYLRRYLKSSAEWFQNFLKKRLY